MKKLIKIVFVIFIVNEIDCLGRVCDNCCDCCDCFKGKKKEENKEENKEDEEIEEYEEIKEEGDNTAISLVNDDWFKNKKNPVLKIFKKKDNNEDNEDKILIKLEGKDNTKITYLQKKEDEDPLKLNKKKYALFEIKTQKEEEKVYLYCSDVESYEDNDFNGIFEKMDHISISVIACNTEEVMNIWGMFYCCSNLKELDLKNFNTKNVTNMASMFAWCTNLKKLKFGINFNTEKVRYIGYMFNFCQNLTELEIVKKFNITNALDSDGMFDNFNEDIKNKIINEVI